MYNEYLERLLKISKYLKHDYAGYRFKSKYDEASRYANDLTSEYMNRGLSDIGFARLATLYLDSFRDPHIRLHVRHDSSVYKEYDYGVDLRHHGDRLYIEGSDYHDLPVGDGIVSIDHRSVKELSHVYRTSLYGLTLEREVWEPILHFAHVVEVEGRDGEVRTTMLDRKHQVAPAKPNSIITLDGSTVLMTLTSLLDGDDIRSLLVRHSATLDSAKYLVIDVRNCQGACEEALLPLLPFIADRGMSIADYLEDACEMQMSETNRRILQESFVAASAGSPMRGMLEDVLSTGDGETLEYRIGIPDELRVPVTRASDCDAVLLTDCRTEGVAEILAEVCRDSSRCIVVGRNTKGSRGTFFSVDAPLCNRFSLEYPIAVYHEEALKRHGNEVGIAPEIRVSWSPEMLERDMDIDAAVDILATAPVSR